MSPPTRVVWIEIFNSLLFWIVIVPSPPTRVVWIEIAVIVKDISGTVKVTTHTGGVD